MSASAQLRALVALRWTMVRAPAARRGLAALAACVPLALVGGAAAARFAPSGALLDFAAAAPTVLLGFFVLSVVSPLTAGGGNELYPPEQLVAYPVRPATHYLTGLAVMPLNLAWLTQLVVVTAVTSFVVRGGWSSLLAVPTLALYVALATATGQLASWLVAGLRQGRTGRVAVWVATGGVVAALLAVARAGSATALLDRSPTVHVAQALVGAGSHAYGFWAATTAALAALTLIALVAGQEACAWALRRPGDAGAHRDTRAVRPRRPRATPAAELRAVDRASVWRSGSLRRGAVVLALLPGLVACAVGVDWTTLILLPGLVASGAALLFGVNAFCLDAGGALWLATLPYSPAARLRSKAYVVAETTVACVLLAVAAALLRVRGTPTRAHVVALATAVVALTLSVLGTALRLSVDRPHRAELSGRRDTPAPPGTMAVYSVRLALQTTFAGLLLGGAAAAGVWWLPPLFGAPVALLGLRSVAYAARRWDDPARRAFITVTVAAG